MDPVSNAAFELGRRVPNATWRKQHLPARSPARASS
jgi:hypothetical protein